MFNAGPLWLILNLPSPIMVDDNSVFRECNPLGPRPDGWIGERAMHVKPRISNKQASEILEIVRHERLTFAQIKLRTKYSDTIVRRCIAYLSSEGLIDSELTGKASQKAHMAVNNE